MRALAVAAAVLAGVLAAAGCGGSGAKPTAYHTAAPPTTRGLLVVPISARTRRDLERHLYTARFLSPTRLAIPRIAGSSNCPSVPAKLIVRSPHAIRVDLVVGSWSRTASDQMVEVPRSPGPCLDDLRPIPVVVAIDPRRVDVHRRLEVSLYFPQGAIRRYKRPVVFTVPPLATARIREEVRVARSSNRGLFSIFPKMPGEWRCLIPERGTQRRFTGMCRTSVHSRPTMEASETVTFTESWWPHCPPMAACSPRMLRHHAWQVLEGETIVTAGSKPHVFATRSRGAKPPQRS